MTCLTHGAIYEIEIGHGVASCKVFLPPSVNALRLNSTEMAALKKRMHDGMEAALAPLFPQFAPTKE